MVATLVSALILVGWVGQAGHDQDSLLGPGDQVPLEFSSYSHPGSLQTPFPYVQEFPAEIF